MMPDVSAPPKRAAESAAPRAVPQYGLASLIGVSILDGYIVSTSLTDALPEMAGVCVRRPGEDPKTGQPYLEELAFLVTTRHQLPQVGVYAKKLVERGVRRFLGILVDESQVFEWRRHSEGKLRPLAGGIRDRSLKRQLRIRALLEAADFRRRSRTTRRTELLRRHLETICGAYGLGWSSERDAVTRELDWPELEALWQYVLRHRTWPEARRNGTQSSNAP